MTAVAPEWPLRTTFEATMTLNVDVIDPDVLSRLFGDPAPTQPEARSVVIDTTDTRPVHEPRPPARPTPSRSLWARLSGANAAAVRSWRGRYAAHLLEHDAWVAAGRPTEETYRVRYVIPRAAIVPASCPPASPAAYAWPPLPATEEPRP